MSTQKASKQFVENFMLVAEYYEFEAHGELEEAKQGARDDMEQAEICYASIAEHVRIMMA